MTTELKPAEELAYDSLEETAGGQGIGKPSSTGNYGPCPEGAVMEYNVLGRGGCGDSIWNQNLSAGKFVKR
jgi:hypothetical protein